MVRFSYRISFFFNDTATTEIYTLSLHDALPISMARAIRASVTVSMLAATIGMFSRSSRVKRVLVSTSRREATDERQGTSRTSSYVNASGGRASEYMGWVKGTRRSAAVRSVCSRPARSGQRAGAKRDQLGFIFARQAAHQTPDLGGDQRS